MVKIIKGFSEIHDFLLQGVSSGSFALRDYFPWLVNALTETTIIANWLAIIYVTPQKTFTSRWRANEDAYWAGKLLSLDVKDATVQQIFFDDNIYFESMYYKFIYDQHR